MKALTKNVAGFTLIEVMIAAAISTIVAVALAVVIVSANRFFSEANQKLQLQQDFSFVESILTHNIRKSRRSSHQIFSSYEDYLSGYSAQSSGTCLKLNFPSGTSQIFYKDDTNFKGIKPDSSMVTLVSGSVSALTFSDNNGSVGIDLTLSAENHSLSGSLEATFRN